MPKSPTAVLVFLLLAYRNDLKLGPHMPKIPTAVLVFSLSVFILPKNVSIIQLS